KEKLTCGGNSGSDRLAGVGGALDERRNHTADESIAGACRVRRRNRLADDVGALAIPLNAGALRAARFDEGATGAAAAGQSRLDKAALAAAEGNDVCPGSDAI